MSITLVTGVPGAGKTLYAVQQAEGYLKAGRMVYTDIDGCVLPGIQPAPEDWRDTPHGSVIIYDEVHQRWPATGKPGRSSDVVVNKLDEHRHTGHDFVLVTQYPTKVHHEVRQLVDRHVHLYRLAGAAVATQYIWPHAILDPNDRKERDGADASPWRYPSHLYEYYKSSTYHTSAYKFRLPRKLAALLSVAGVIAIYTIYAANTSTGMLGAVVNGNKPAITVSAGGGVGGGVAASVAATPPHTYIIDDLPPIEQVTVPAVYGCVSTATRCLCFGSDGRAIRQTQEDCRAMHDLPLAIQLPVARKERT